MGIVEDNKHIVMQCPIHESTRLVMYEDKGKIDDGDVRSILVDAQKVFSILMGKHS